SGSPSRPRRSARPGCSARSRAVSTRANRRAGWSQPRPETYSSISSTALVSGCAAMGVLLKPGELRAARLTELGEARPSLLHLGGLLGDVGIALVGLACAARDEATYWQCMEAIDAADESRDRVLDMLRKLADREAALPEREPH